MGLGLVYSAVFFVEGAGKSWRSVASDELNFVACTYHIC